MLIRRRQAWELPEREATSEALFLNRRRVMQAGVATVAAVGLPRLARAAESPDKTLDLYPAKRNPAFTLDRDVTPEEINAHYNNFYEFGSSKDVADAAAALKTRPWTVKFTGLVEKPREVGIDDLIRAMPLQERLYRHRCVEAWGMAIPWTGFPLKALLDYAKPLSGAKYVKMTTFKDASMAPGQRQFWYPWPYVEGLTMAEAANDLAFMVTGAYGKPLARVFGAPLRLAVPWKYGFKSVKSIVEIAFVTERPKTFWEGLQSSEYGFWANVNPAVPHPRWSQASEEVLGTSERRPTLIYNGYGDQVAGLYTDLQNEKLFM